jgi:hypothetical protein
MSWSPQIMPDEALDPDCLVGRILGVPDVQPGAVEEAVRFMEKYDSEGPGWAEAIEALRDDLVPEEQPEPDYLCGDLGWIVNTEEAIRCDERQRLRAILTEQARIAREHPNGQHSQQGPEGDGSL